MVDSLFDSLLSLLSLFSEPIIWLLLYILAFPILWFALFMLPLARMLHRAIKAASPGVEAAEGSRSIRVIVPFYDASRVATVAACIAAPALVPLALRPNCLPSMIVLDSPLSQKMQLVLGLSNVALFASLFILSGLLIFIFAKVCKSVAGTAELAALYTGFLYLLLKEAAIVGIVPRWRRYVVGGNCYAEGVAVRLDYDSIYIAAFLIVVAALWWYAQRRWSRVRFMLGPRSGAHCVGRPRALH